MWTRIRAAWRIQAFFNEIRQTLQLTDFLRHDVNAVRWQVQTAMLTYVRLRFRRWTGLLEAIHAQVGGHVLVDGRGYDAGKKANGRKRHLLVDTLGLILKVLVLPANIQDRDGAKRLPTAFFGRSRRRRLKHLWADGGYTGSLVAWAQRLWRCTIQIVKRTDAHTFRVLPRRWVVERAFGWLGRSRPLNRDYKRQVRTGETTVCVAMIQLMLSRPT